MIIVFMSGSKRNDVQTLNTVVDKNRIYIMLKIILRNEDISTKSCLLL
jgi:hypothetical protein